MLITIPFLLLIGALIGRVTFVVMLVLSLAMIAFSATLVALSDRADPRHPLQTDIKRILGARARG